MSSVDALQDELALAIRVADAADAMSLPYFEKRTFTLSRKADHSEVTEADRNTETAITDLLVNARPRHAIYGEEHGTIGDADSTWTWVIDPIDGTSNFVRGVPVWATLVALVHRDLGPVVGVVSAPAMQTRWWGVHEGGAYCNGHPIRVSDVSELSEATLSITDNAPWRDLGHGEWVKNLKKSVKRLRGFGDFWQHMLVAQGSIDIAVDAIGLEPYDIAALIPVVHAAGGRLTDRDGNVNWRADTAITTNGRVAIPPL